MLGWIKKNIFPFILLFVSVALFLTNYKPGTFLVGWDNLFPEFNFKLNITRDFYAVWQQYRGLGALDNFAQSSNLVHDLFRLFLSLFFSTSLIRWVFVLLMHFLGGLGIYRLIRGLDPRFRGDDNRTNTKFIAFFGALFYMLNLGTIQQFFLPLEVFVIHFAALPWLFLSGLKYFEKGNKKNLLIFSGLSILATPQAFVPTVFAVYFSGFFIFFLSKTIADRFINIKRFFILIAAILVTNAFWILPTGYSFLTHSKEVAKAKNYQMASNDIFYRNKKYGDFASMALIKGVVLGFQATDNKTNSNHFMMWPWLSHINTPYFLIPAWIFFFLSLFGLYKTIKNKNKTLYPFAAIFIFTFLMMGTDIPIVNWPINILRNFLPIFAIIFRFTFTKFSILYVFSYSIFLAIGLKYAIELTKKYWLTLVCILLLLFYSLPAFQGHFFYENLAVKIPHEYFQAFDFFNQQNNNERVAILPIPWYWAWLQPKWGTINSGFIWYGIPQVVTDLAFTPWGASNENYYWELDQAIFSKNISLLEKVLDKYDISWIYLDKNILNEPGRKMTFEKYEELLNGSKNIQLEIQFGEINIYKYHLKNNLNNFVEIKNDLPSIGPKYDYDSYDQAYIDYGDYLPSNDSQAYYPFRSLFSGKDPKDIEYKVDEDDKFIYFRSQLPTTVNGWKIQNSNPLEDELNVVDEKLKTNKYSPEMSILEGVLTVKIDKKVTQLYQSSVDQKYLNLTNDACQKNENGTAVMEKAENNNYKFTSINSENCVKIDFPNLSQKYGYIFNIKTESDNKRGLHINLINKTTEKSDLETYADNDGNDHNYYFIASPRGAYDLGYILYINNISEGSEKVINTLKNINIYQIPYYFLKNLKLVKNSNPIDAGNNGINVVEVEQKNVSNYKVNVDKVNSNSVLYLSQSYSPGWIAFSNGKLLEHVVVNNWSNGWILTGPTSSTTNVGTSRGKANGSTVTIVFWPQYLEFLGFALLAIAIFRILLIRQKT